MRAATAEDLDQALAAYQAVAYASYLCRGSAAAHRRERGFVPTLTRRPDGVWVLEGYDGPRVGTDPRRLAAAAACEEHRRLREHLDDLERQRRRAAVALRHLERQYPGLARPAAGVEALDDPRGVGARDSAVG